MSAITILNLDQFTFTYVLHNKSLYEGNDEALEKVDAMFLFPADFKSLIRNIAEQYKLELFKDYSIQNVFPHYFFLPTTDSMGNDELKIFGSNSPMLTGDETPIYSLDYKDINKAKHELGNNFLHADQLALYVENKLLVPFAPNGTFEFIHE